MQYRLEILILAIIVFAIGYVLLNYIVLPDIGIPLGNIVMLIGAVIFVIWLILLAVALIQGRKS